MEKIKEIDFANRCLGAIGYEKSSALAARRILKALDLIDSKKSTQYEYSFKIKRDELDYSIRFLNMDCNGYSWKYQRSFRKRLDLLQQILEKYSQNSMYKPAMDALRSISSKPMDLYFGFDAAADGLIFAYWLILGGVSKDGSVNLVRYDKKDIFKKVLASIGAKLPKMVERPILNLGVDITKGDLFYKVYYLCEEKVLEGYSFSSFMPEINSAFNDRRFFYFFSEMYDLDGKLVKDKLFMEFLEDIPNDVDGIAYICQRISNISRLEIDLNKIADVLSRCGGKLCLMSFEKDLTVTFYVRSGN